MFDGKKEKYTEKREKNIENHRRATADVSGGKWEKNIEKREKIIESTAELYLTFEYLCQWGDHMSKQGSFHN